MLVTNMRKIIICGIVALMPLFSFAEGCVGPTCLFGMQICKSDPCHLSDVMKAIEAVIHFLAIDVAIPIAVLGVAVAGFKMIISHGNAGEFTKAKDLLWVILKGVVYALAAYLIVKAIVVGLTGGNTPEGLINDVISQ